MADRYLQDASNFRLQEFRRASFLTALLHKKSAVRWLVAAVHFSHDSEREQKSEKDARALYENHPTLPPFFASTLEELWQADLRSHPLWNPTPPKFGFSRVVLPIATTADYHEHSGSDDDTRFRSEEQDYDLDAAQRAT